MTSSCKQTLEISVPADEVEQETQRIVQEIGARAVLPGFRKGKVPPTIIRSRFAAEIREELIHSLVPKYFQKEVDNRNLNVVGSPSIRDVRIAAGEPMTFRAEFEVAPEFELKDYRGISVPYQEPKVTAEEVEQRLEQIRQQKADFVNLEPRPAQDGDYVVISLEALSGEVKLGKQDELVVHIGDQDTLPEFSENLRGAAPGEEREFEVSYPEDYGDERLAGRKVRFRAAVKALRRREVPELNDAFAADLGNFGSLEELREAVRRSMQMEQEYKAQQAAKDKLVDALVEMHDFPVPEALVNRQVETQLRDYAELMAARGMDPRRSSLDWNALRDSARQQAIRDVKASLLLDRIADREAIEVTNEDLEKELQRIARAERQPVAAVRKRLEEERGLGRLVSRIRVEKTLNFLFEQARKVVQD